MVLTVKDIVQSLNGRAESYAKFLLPGGKLANGEWECGSINGEAGKSLKVRVSGDKAGIWADFAADQKGDLIGLTMAVKNVAINEAIRIAKEWLGIRSPENAVPRKNYAKPKTKGMSAVDDKSAAFTYLAEDRKIDVFTQTDFRLGQAVGKFGPEVIFPYFSPDGTLLNMKHLPLKRDANGKKQMYQESGCAPCLFGWQAIKPDCREVIITEGEIDTLTWHQMGFPALSIPDGAEGSSWLDVEWDNLERFDTIWLNWDNDPAGQKAVKSFARRLGFARCNILTVPGYKDANEALMAGAEEDLFAKAIASAKPISPDQIKSPNEFRDRVIERFYPQDGKPPGFFPAIFNGKFGMRPGDLTIWTGISGHGKSAMLSQLMIEAVLSDYKVALGSFEMLPEQTLHRALCQSEAENPVRRDKIAPLLDYLSERMWIYDILGNVSPKLVLELLEYSYVRHGVNLFVIDSLMKCSVASDDYNAQRVFLNDLCAFAKDTRTHVNLVAHSRKGQDESDAPGKLDVKGSSDIINQADNIISVWRNKDKEQAAFNGIQKPDEPDAIIYCNKQRENGDEFATKLRFRRGAFFFAPMNGARQDISLWNLIQKQNQIQMEPATAAIPEANETD